MLGRTWSTFRGETVLFIIEGCSLQHGLGTQDSDQIRNSTWSSGDFGPDRAPGRVLCVLLTYVLVCRTRRCCPSHSRCSRYFRLNRLGLHVNMTRVYANTFCESILFFSAPPCSSALIPRAVAMLNAREGLKEELRMKSVTACAFEVYNHNSFQVSRKEADDATEAPQSVWMETIRREKSADALGAAQVQVDRKVMVATM